MGLCVSRRAIRKEEERAPELKRSSSEMINPARLLLESPRISTDIADMGMLGLLFHKRYCCKSLDPKSSRAKPEEQELKYHKLKPEGSPEPRPQEQQQQQEQQGMVIQENALFEEQRREEEEAGDDGYPTFEPNSGPSQQQQQQQQQSQTTLRGREEGRVWQSAGEEFYSEWEDRLRGKDKDQLQFHRAQESREIGVFGAEDYFKEGEDEAPKKQEQHPVNTTTDCCPSSTSSPATSSACSGSSSAPSASSSCPLSSSSGSGMKWATLCAGASAVEVDELPASGSAPAPSKKNKSRPAKSEILHISKMFKLLASPSSSPSTKSSLSHKHKKARTLESPQPGEAPEANPPEGETKVGFGSPFPSSSNLAEIQRTSEEGPGEEKQEQNEGNESDSSSDLFELDSVTTSLSSARSSLSRLSSARSSVRKSTVDEQDILHLISDSSRPAGPKQHEVQPASAPNPDESSSSSSAPGSSSSAPSSSSTSTNVALLIMKSRRSSSRMPLLEPGPLLSILEESKPSGGQRRVSKQLNNSSTILWFFFI